MPPAETLLSRLALWIYSGLFLLAAFGWRLPWERLRARGGRSLRQSLAREAPQGMHDCLWMHAVSVGEVRAVAPLLEKLMERRPGLKILLSTTTATGAAQVRALFGERVRHAYFPWDLPWVMRRFLRRVRPRAVALAETELWPNLAHQCGGMNIPVVSLNARLSESSARGYARIKSLSSAMLKELTAVAAQTEQDGKRFLALGLPEERLLISGNLKFDIERSEQTRERALELRRLWGERPVWAAGSTHEGEEAAVLEACRGLWKRFPELLLILAPRHPRRFAAAAGECAKATAEFPRRSAGEWGDRNSRLLLVDSIGELPLLLAAADAAFIGGSLAPKGGHNMLEAAVWGTPVVCGPHTFNFHEAAELLERAGALKRARNAGELRTVMERWLEDPQARKAAGQAGAEQCAAKRGALEKQLALLESFLRAA